MFHVKHTYFVGLKTLILSNTACLEPSFTLRRKPARYALDLALGSDRYDKLLALAIAPQILTKETRMVFLLYREQARSHTTRQYAQTSFSLNTFIDKASSETINATDARRTLRTHIRNHPYFYRQQIPFRKQNRRSNENAPHAFVGQPRKKPPKPR